MNLYHHNIKKRFLRWKANMMNFRRSMISFRLEAAPRMKVTSAVKKKLKY